MKALALISGGLDSVLAAQLILNQGVDVIGINFLTPFCMLFSCPTLVNIRISLAEILANGKSSISMRRKNYFL